MATVRRETINPDGTVTVDDVPVPVEQANSDTIESKLRQALTVNRAYLAKTTPTAAETTAQVKSLTRQVLGLEMLLLRQLDDVSGT